VTENASIRNETVDCGKTDWFGSTAPEMLIRLEGLCGVAGRPGEIGLIPGW
jgi:hypothetical protein